MDARRSVREHHLAELIATQLLDDTFDCYVDWRDEAARVRAAYRRWTESPQRERPGAYVAYRAAVDREERASELYAAMIGCYQRHRRPRGD